MAKKTTSSTKTKPNSKAKTATKPKSKTKTGTRSSQKNFISKAPIRRLMKEEGASLVSDQALEIMIAALEKHAISTTKKALEFVKDEKRKRLTAEDINFAVK